MDQSQDNVSLRGLTSFSVDGCFCWQAPYKFNSAYWSSTSSSHQKTTCSGYDIADNIAQLNNDHSY